MRRSMLRFLLDLQHAATLTINAVCCNVRREADMQITSSAEAGALVKSLRESRKLSRKELSDASGIPLRTVYAVEKGELNNLSLDRFIALTSALGAYLDVRVSDANPSEDAEVNRLINMIATENLDADRWGIAP